MITHYTALVERHSISSPVPRPCPVGEVLFEMRQQMWAKLADNAESWAASQGMAIEVEPYEKQDGKGHPSVWGVQFTILIGRGMEPTSGPSQPKWVWSDRWKSWLTRFRRLERPHIASVDGANVLPFPAAPGA